MPDSTTGTSSNNLTFTARIARWSARHKWITLAASAGAIVLAVLSIMFVGTETRDDEGGVGESGKAYELLDERFRSAPAPAPDPNERRVATRFERLVVANPSLDAESSEFRGAVDGLLEKIRALPNVAEAGSFYDTGDTDMLADDRNAVLGFVRLEDESVRSSRDIDIGPLQKAMDETAAASAGFEMELYSFRLIDDEIDEILTEDFNRILFLSMGIGLVYVSVASSPATSMPSTKLRMRDLRSGNVPSCRNSRKSATYPLISSLVGSSTLRCSN